MESSCNNNNNNNDKRYYSSLHAIRKPLIMKKPIAPLPPTKPRVYKVNPAEFKEVVQRLTAAAASNRPRPRPRPLDLMISTTTAARRSTQNLWSTPTTTTDINNNNSNNGMVMMMMGSFEDDEDIANKKVGAAAVVTPPRESNYKLQNKYLESCGALSPAGFSFSPSAMNWPFSPLLSPGTLASLEHATVL